MRNTRTKKFKEVSKTMLEKEVDGVEHVLVPKDAWIKICEVLRKIDKMGGIE